MYKKEWNCEQIFTGWWQIYARNAFKTSCEKIEKFIQTGNTDFIYRNGLDKACFQHDMAYGKSKDLTKKTQSEKD